MSEALPIISVRTRSATTRSVSPSGFRQRSSPSRQVVAPTVAQHQPAPAGRPVIRRVTAAFDGIFLAGAAFDNTFTAQVDWAGGTPGVVMFYANDVLVQSVPPAGTEAAGTVNMGANFAGSFRSGVNKVRVVAVDGQGRSSAAFDKPVSVIPSPAFLFSALASVVVDAASLGRNDPMLAFDFQFPSADIPSAALHNFPIVGSAGMKLAVGAGFAYNLRTGEWQVHAGIAPYGRFAGQAGPHSRSTLLHPKLDLANVEFEFDVMSRADGVATLARGIEVRDTLVEINLRFEEEIMRFYLTDSFPGGQGLGALLDVLARLGVDVGSIQKIKVIAFGEIGAELHPQFIPLPFRWGDTTLNLKVGLKAVYEPDLFIGKASIYLGGSLETVMPLQPNFHLESTTLKAFNSKIEVIGVQTDNSPQMKRSFEEAKSVAIEHKTSIAEGISGEFELDNMTFPIIQKVVDRIETVSDDELIAAMLWMFENHQIVTEPSGVPCIAYLLRQPKEVVGKKIMLTVSGRNVSTAKFLEFIEKAKGNS